MLDICKILFENLNSQGIKYCHWKSNLYLDRSLAGKTDLDLLVHINDKDAFEQLLDKLLIKRIISPAEKRFDGMDDFMGFDHITGELIHLHVHYRLILGQRYIKNHHLPIEGLIFQNLTVKNNVNIPCPEIELLLLIIRAHMKVDLLSLIKHGIKGFTTQGYTAFPADIEAELSDLIRVYNIEKFKGILKKTELSLEESLFATFIERFTAKNLKFHDILLTQWKILHDLKDYRRNKGLEIHMKYLYFIMREMPFVNNFITPKRKRLSGYGKVFSIVGADGSGKSTLVGDLNKWLSWKLSVKNYYHGIPKIYFVELMSFAMRGFDKFRMNFITNFIRYYLWIYIAKKRYRISILSQEDSRNGNIVITDRFPLRDFHSMAEPMDGPRLMLDNTKIGKYCFSVEKQYYDRILFPDCLFVLQVPIEELRRRKSDLDIKLHIAKADAVNAVAANEKIVLINAEKAYSEVQLEIKSKIWELI